MAIITVLAALATVGARNAVWLSREATLKEDLFRMRDAIDQYYADKGKYPADLQALVTDQYMREVPIDPMTHSQEWGMRSYQDDSDSTSWGGQNVYDVYSKSEGVALDGTKYVDW